MQYQTSDVAVYALLYGDYPKLHGQLVQGFNKSLPRSVPVYLWCNQLGSESKKIINWLDNMKAVISEDNVPKYKAMRSLFDSAPRPKITVYFDDDSYINKPDYFSAWLDKFSTLNAHCLGKTYVAPYLEGQMDFVKNSYWYKGKEPYLHKKKPHFLFAQGAHWWIRTDILEVLKWPDDRLSHNGGDCLLGEALRQNGYTMNNYDYGIKINASPRRGISECPLGCTNTAIRR